MVSKSSGRYFSMFCAMSEGLLTLDLLHLASLSCGAQSSRLCYEAHTISQLVSTTIVPYLLITTSETTQLCKHGLFRLTIRQIVRTRVAAQRDLVSRLQVRLDCGERSIRSPLPRFKLRWRNQNQLLLQASRRLLCLRRGLTQRSTSLLRPPLPGRVSQGLRSPWLGRQR